MAKDNSKLSDGEVKKMSLDELTAEAKKRGVELTDEMKTKADIAEAINAVADDGVDDDEFQASGGTTELSYDTSAVQPKEGETPVYGDARTGNIVTPNNAVVSKASVKKGEGGSRVSESVAHKAETGKSRGDD